MVECVQCGYGTDSMDSKQWLFTTLNNWQWLYTCALDHGLWFRHLEQLLNGRILKFLQGWLTIRIQRCRGAGDILMLSFVSLCVLLLWHVTTSSQSMMTDIEPQEYIEESTDITFSPITREHSSLIIIQRNLSGRFGTSDKVFFSWNYRLLRRPSECCLVE